MATEAQIQELERRYTEVEARRNYCCRDIVVWKTYTRIVSPDGIVISNFIDNVVVGTARRGMPFTVTFSPKWNGSLYEDYRSMPPNSSGNRIYSNNFQINVVSNYGANPTATNATQSEREAIDYVLINSTSTSVSSNTNSSFNDVRETYNGTQYLLSGYSVPITRNCTITDADTCAPLRTFPVYTTYYGNDGGNFYIYRQSDGTITVDVKDRTVYRGVQNAYLDDPAHLLLFFTQFVLKARA